MRSCNERCHDNYGEHGCNQAQSLYDPRANREHRRRIVVMERGGADSIGVNEVVYPHDIKESMAELVLG